MATKTWTFTQTTGPKKTLTLSGKNAPFGRARKGPVVTDAIKLRTERIYYPDAIGTPTTHVFGIAYEDWSLKGRAADSDLGSDGAKKFVTDWQAFVADAQPVRITWGDVLSAVGFVHKFTPERESEFEVAYTLDIHIDEEPGVLVSAGSRFADASAADLCAKLQLEVSDGLNVPSLPNAGDLKPSFLDSLDELVSTVNGLSASLLKVASEFDAFASGTLDQLDRLRAGVAQIRTAVISIRSTIETTSNDGAMLSRSADSDIQWFSARANNDVGTLRIMAFLDEIDREAELAQRGQILAVYLARLGDSWESIARQFYGGPQSAGKIRDANGVKYGEFPTPGRSYSIPTAA